MTSMRQWLLSQIFLCSFLLTFKAIQRKEGIALNVQNRFKERELLRLFEKPRK